MQETSEEKEMSLCVMYTLSPTDLNQQTPPSIPRLPKRFLIYHRALVNLGDRQVGAELCLATSRANLTVETETHCTDD